MTPCELPVVDEQVQLGLRAFGQALGGIGLVHLDGEAWSLSLLTPTGLELFTVSGPPKVVAAGVASWGPWLAKMPVERDLRLVFTPGETDCALEGARLLHRDTDDGWVRRWRGEGGPARARRQGERVELAGPGYRLVLIRPELPAPEPPPVQLPPRLPGEAIAPAPEAP